MFKIKENIKTRKNLVVINKKYIKKSTERNLLKRRIKNILNEISKNQEKYFYFFVISPELRNLNFNDLKKKILEYLNYK